jgi:trk system potassium uptake protein TrkH
MILLALNKKISIKDRALLMDYFNLENIGGIIKFIRRVVRGIIIVEFIGALLYSFVFIPKYGLARGIWYSVFHSISAFCNAGIDIL